MKYRGFSAGTTLLVLGLGCANPKREATGCTVSGIPFADGTTNPQNQCQVCSAKTNPVSWTNRPSGVYCSGVSSGVCVNGNCTAGCQISGMFYGPADPSPDNACLTCQPKISVSSFTPATGFASGGSCGNGSYCYKGQCSGGCSIAGDSHAPGDLDPSNPCMGCVPTLSTTAWSNLDPGTRCGSGVCVGGACLQGCNIAGVLVASGALEPSDVCHSCQPAVNPTAWSPVTGLPSGGCAGGQVCLDGGCVVGCFIDNSFHVSGEFRDIGDLRIDASCCGPSHDPSAWSPVFTAGPITRNQRFAGPFAPTRYGNPPPLVADLNRDGRPDLAVLRLDPLPPLTTTIDVYLGSSDGGFDQSSPGVLDYTSLALADLNRDGYADLVASDADGGVQVLLNRRDGTFGLATGYSSNISFYDGGTDDAGSFITYSSLWSGQQPSLAVEDFNGDGVPDVLVAGGPFGGLSLLLGVGNGDLSPGVSVTSGTTSTYAVQVSDLNGDGLPDLFIHGDTTFGWCAQCSFLAFQTGDPAFVLMPNDGQGGFGLPLSGPLAAAFSTGPTVHDLNGDLRADLAFPIGLMDPPLVLLGVGDGSFTATDLNPDGAPMVVTDLNADGLPDLVLGGGPGPTLIFVNLGNGNFSHGIVTPGPPDLWSGAATDLNGDGLDDLAVEDSNGNVSIWLNNCR